MSFNTFPQNPFPPNSENAGGGGLPYVLPIASAETLGGVKVGNNLTIDANGVLSAPPPVPSYSATEQATGQKWIDGKDIYFKTIVLEESTAVQANSWLTIGELAAETVLNVDVINTDAYYFPFGGGINSGNLEIFNLRNAAMTITKIIVYYTKVESEV